MRICEPLLLFVLFGATPAFAQQTPGFDAHGFQLAAHDGDLRDPLTVQRPGTLSQGDVFMSILGEYAKAPLVLVQEAQQSNQVVETPVVDNLVVANLGAGIAAHDHLRIDIKAPVYLMNTDPSRDATLGPAPGDLRTSAMVLFLRPRHVIGGGGPGLGLVGHVDVPVGTPDRFLGQSGVAGGVKLAFTYEFPVVTLTADMGSQFNPALELDNLNGSDELIAGLGIGALASESVGLTAEINAKPPFELPDNVLFPAEALGHLKFRDPTSGAYLTLGGATGLTSGPGVAAFRAFLGFGISRIEEPRAADFDTLGSFQMRDQCPREVETDNGWKDDDGCPDTLAALSIDVRYDGMPYEAQAKITGPEGPRDEYITTDGLQIDAVPGSSWSVEATAGNCLEGAGQATATEKGTSLTVDLFPKLDARAIVEVVDTASNPIDTATVTWTGEASCLPEEVEIPVNTQGVLDQYVGMGTHHLYVTAPGYSIHESDVELAPGGEKRVLVQLAPSLVQITREKIEILEKVQFETAKAVIKPESFDLLDEVANTINTYPDLGRVEVQGHTDSKGSDAYNQTLSEKRAAAVMGYLVDKGQVDPARLISQGYGETTPVDTNKTEIGREANRRVEFKLIDQEEDQP